MCYVGTASICPTRTSNCTVKLRVGVNLFKCSFSKSGFLIFILIINLISINQSIASTKDISSDKTNFRQHITSISSNPASVNLATGLGSFRYNGLSLGGAWLADTNYLISGGLPNPKRWTSNNLFIGSLLLDTKKSFNWEGGLFGIEFLQFNGQVTDYDAGSVQEYNGLPGRKPLNRSELYQLWYSQELFDKKLDLRIGKTIPSFDFNNVSKPVIISDEKYNIPAVSGLLYTPIFVNTSMYGVLPGYYNSAYGLTIKFAPIKQWYISYGIYDGNLARGVQTGKKVGPTLNGSYFKIGETGLSWLLGKNALPGKIGVGAWSQDGRIQLLPSVRADHALGAYLFGTQRLWYRHPGVDNSGISTFFQYGINNSNALPINQYTGAGLTAFGLTPCRPDDSMGFGTAFSWLNHNFYPRRTELMFQVYYQAKVIKAFYLEPAISYIPTPGASSSLNPDWAATLRAMLLF